MITILRNPTWDEALYCLANILNLDGIKYILQGICDSDEDFVKEMKESIIKKLFMFINSECTLENFLNYFVTDSTENITFNSFLELINYLECRDIIKI